MARWPLLFNCLASFWAVGHCDNFNCRDFTGREDRPSSLDRNLDLAVYLLQDFSMRALVFLLALDFVRPVGHTVVLYFAMRVPGRYGGISIVVGGGCGVFARKPPSGFWVHPTVFGTTLDFLGLPVLDHPPWAADCLVLCPWCIGLGTIGLATIGLATPRLGNF